MGNANGSEEEEEEEESGAVRVSMADQDGAHAYIAEFMGQSPPPSPRAFQSPFVFRPQVSCFNFFSNFFMGFFVFCFN